MVVRYDDYSGHLGLRLCHRLRVIRHLPVRGIGRLTDILLLAIPKPTPTGPCIIETAHGFRMLVDPVRDGGLERALFVYGTYEEGTLSVMTRILPKDGLFVDVGANIGLMTLHAARVMSAGKVLSLEPLASSCEILRQNVELNAFTNVTIENLAIGAASGTVEIFDSEGLNRGSSSLFKPDDGRKGHAVPIRKLDDVLAQREGGGHVDCVKVDVEGWELEVLKGAGILLSRPDGPMCIVECSAQHPTYGGRHRDIYTFLRAANDYRVFRLARSKEKPSRLVEVSSEGQLPRHDNLFCFLPRHIEGLPGDLFA